MFGKVENPKNEGLLDLSHREFATFAPLIILAVWIGLYPKPFLDRLKTSVDHVMARVDPQYSPTRAALPALPGRPQPDRGMASARQDGASVSAGDGR